MQLSFFFIIRVQFKQTEVVVSFLFVAYNSVMQSQLNELFQFNCDNLSSDNHLQSQKWYLPPHSF